jgi:hypothetical protein
MNPGGMSGGNALLGNPPLRVAGVDTLYTYLTNSFAWREDDLASACGARFLSPLHGKPVIMRYDDPDPLSSQGKVVWIGVPLYNMAGNHLEDLKRMMRLNTDWVFRE